MAFSNVPRHPFRAELTQRGTTGAASTQTGGANMTRKSNGAAPATNPAAQPSASYAAGHVDTDLMGALLGELAGIRMELAQIKGAAAGSIVRPDDDFRQDVRIEIAQMVKAIARTKMELAAIRHPMAEGDDQINSASSELDAIIQATEQATNRILDANEDIERQLAIISAHASDAGEEDILTAAEHISTRLTDIYEASNFQDITGQRITKVIKTLRFLEDRILAMINVFGVHAFMELPIPEQQTTDADAALLNGPQLANAGITQAEIDALFD